MYVHSLLFCLFQTVGYDPLVPAEAAAQFNVEFLELEQLWPVVDFITVHTPLIKQTRGGWVWFDPVT